MKMIDALLKLELQLSGVVGNSGLCFQGGTVNYVMHDRGNFEFVNRCQLRPCTHPLLHPSCHVAYIGYLVVILLPLLWRFVHQVKEYKR